MIIKRNMVAQHMEALGETVRSQPIDTVRTWEALHRIELLTNKIYELASALGIETVTHSNFKFKHELSHLNPADVLRILSELEYLYWGTKHTLGLARYDLDAFSEVHESNCSKVWPDGAIHRGPDGRIVLPTDFHKPDMKPVLERYAPPSLFEQHPPKIVQHDDGTEPLNGP